MSTSDEIIALRQGYQARRAERQAQEREQELSGRESENERRVKQRQRLAAAPKANSGSLKLVCALRGRKSAKDVCGSLRATPPQALSGTGPRSRSRSSWRITGLAVATSPSSDLES